MAYIRWRENYSDIYLVHDGALISCVDCPLDANADFLYRSDVISHLLYHQSQGHKVPEWVINWIENEMREEGDPVSNYVLDLIV